MAGMCKTIAVEKRGLFWWLALAGSVLAFCANFVRYIDLYGYPNHTRCSLLRVGMIAYFDGIHSDPKYGDAKFYVTGGGLDQFFFWTLMALFACSLLVFALVAMRKMRAATVFSLFYLLLSIRFGSLLGDFLFTWLHSVCFSIAFAAAAACCLQALRGSGAEPGA